MFFFKEKKLLDIFYSCNYLRTIEENIFTIYTEIKRSKNKHLMFVHVGIEQRKMFIFGLQQ